MWFANRSVRGFVAAVVATAIALGGCATPQFPKQDLSPQSAALIKTLAVLRVEDPERLTAPVDIGVGTGAAFGIFGPIGVVALIGFQAQRIASRNAEFSIAIAPEQASFAALLAHELASALAAHAVRVETLNEYRPKPQGGDSFDYSGIPTTMNAWLHVRILGIGYINDPSGAVSAPYVEATALLIEPGSGAKLFQRRILVHPYPRKVQGLDTVPGATQAQFPNYGALLASPAPAAEALRMNVKALAKHIVLALDLPLKDGAAPPP